VEKPQIQASTGLDKDILTHSLFLTGPTAVGKTEVSVVIAKQFNAEVISVDSMQVFKGLEIASAKPRMAERKDAPHHLIDCANLQEPYDTARFLREAKTAAADVISRKKKVIFCGGTGLYFQALLYGVGEAPCSNHDLREELNKRPLEELVIELKTLDPNSYHSIDLQNKRRVVRALEVTRLTGKPFVSFRSNWKFRTDQEIPTIFCLVRERDDLKNRINCRVDEMIHAGLVQEAKDFYNQEGTSTSLAGKIIGYRQLQNYLAGMESLEAAKERIKAATRQYSKRQMTWFRNQLPITEIPWSPEKSAQEIAFQIGDLWHSRPLNKLQNAGMGKIESTSNYKKHQN
jgi:tRNA dimethylallyltransferase